MCLVEAHADLERARLVVVIGGVRQYIGARVVADEVVVVALAFIGIQCHLQSADQVAGGSRLFTHQLGLGTFRVPPDRDADRVPHVIHPLAGRRSALEDH